MWYYVKDNAQVQIEFAELAQKLKAGEISRETLVWGPELPEWVKAGACGELLAAAGIEAEAPPVPDAAPAGPPPPPVALPPVAGGPPPVSGPSAGDDLKIYRILSYIGILWLVGMLVPQAKDDAKVKFHVGQGMLLSIAGIGGGIAVNIVAAIFRTILVAAGSYSLASAVGSLFSLLSWAVSVATFAFAIMGIIAANNNEEKPLPLIGQYAFYGKKEAS